MSEEVKFLFRATLASGFMISVTGLIMGTVLG